MHNKKEARLFEERRVGNTNTLGFTVFKCPLDAGFSERGLWARAWVSLRPMSDAAFHAHSRPPAEESAFHKHPGGSVCALGVEDTCVWEKCLFCVSQTHRVLFSGQCQCLANLH